MICFASSYFIHLINLWIKLDTGKMWKEDKEE